METRYSSGFTLIEVLLALALFALLALAVALMIDQSTRQNQLQRERSQNRQDISLFWQLLEKDIDETLWRVRKEKFGSGLNSYYETDQGRSLSWVSAGQSRWVNGQLQRQAQRVVWRLNQGVIERLSTAIIDPAVTEEAQFEPLLEGVKSWRWRFWMNGAWRSELPTLKQQPEAVELEVHFTREDHVLTGRFSLVEQVF